MLELLIAVLMAFGLSLNEGGTTTISTEVYQKIQSASNYKELGGDTELSRYATVSDTKNEDITICHEVDPVNNR